MNILRIDQQGNLELRLSIPLHPPENTGDEEQESLGGVTVTADPIEVAGLQSALAEAEAKLATAEKERDHWKNLGSSVEFMQGQNEGLGKANARLIEELKESKQRVELLENNNTALNNNYEHAEKLIRTLCDALDISYVKWVDTVIDKVRVLEGDIEHLTKSRDEYKRRAEDAAKEWNQWQARHNNLERTMQAALKKSEEEEVARIGASNLAYKVLNQRKSGLEKTFGMSTQEAVQLGESRMGRQEYWTAEEWTKFREAVSSLDETWFRDKNPEGYGDDHVHAEEAEGECAAAEKSARAKLENRTDDLAVISITAEDALSIAEDHLGPIGEWGTEQWKEFEASIDVIDPEWYLVDVE